MNNEVEQSIITVLLAKPELISTVNINSDWFIDHNYRAIFEAISNLGENANLMDVYGKAKSIYKGITTSYHDLGVMQDNYITDQSLQSNAINLKWLAMQREVSEAIAEYQANPFGDAQQNLFEALSKLNGADETADSGSLNEAIADLEYRLTHPMPSGIKSYEKLDKILAGGLYGSMLFTIGARPSVGKTAYSVNLAVQIMEHDPEVRVDYFTLEMSKREMLNRFISRKAHVMTQSLRNPAESLNSIQLQIIKDAMKWVNDSQLNVYDHTPYLTNIISTIRRNASRAKTNKYVVIVDYIGLVSVRGQSDRRLQIEEITRQLKVVANEFDISVIALAQLNRGIESRQDKTPQLSDLRDSGSVEQDSNIVAFLWRPDESARDQVQLIVQKNREGFLGKINYHYLGSEMLFQELSE